MALFCCVCLLLFGLGKSIREVTFIGFHENLVQTLRSSASSGCEGAVWPHERPWTASFSDPTCLGAGVQGTVWHAKLEGQEVAVKINLKMTAGNQW